MTWVTIESHGARIGVSLDASLLPTLERELTTPHQAGQLDPLDASFELTASHGSGETPTFDVSVGPDRLATGADAEAAVRCLDSEVHFQIALHARTVLFVHAGVVGWRRRAIVIPGRSHAGKTSLVAALLRAGADYYSDEYALVDAQGRVHPYPRPLSIRGSDGVGRPVPPGELGAQVGTEPLRGGLLAVTWYTPEATYAPETVGQARGLMHLIDNTVIVRERPQLAMDHLGPLAHATLVLTGARGEASQAAAELLRRLDQHIAETERNERPPEETHGRPD